MSIKRELLECDIILNLSLPSKHGQKVLVICMNYFSDEDTIAFARSVLSQNHSSAIQVLVVDNSTVKPPNVKLHPLQGDNNQVTILYPERNLGYFGGAAWGLKRYLETEELPEWVLVTNTDIEFPDQDFFRRLFELYPDGFNGVVAPSILSGMNGCNQNPFMKRRPSKYRMHFLKWVFMTYPTLFIYQSLAMIKSMIKKGKLADCNEVLQPMTIYAPHGSFILFDKKYFLSGGNLDYDVFLFGEEVFVAETVRRKKVEIRFDPRLSVLHQEHATTGIIKNKKMAKFVKESSAYCADQYFRE